MVSWSFPPLFPPSLGVDRIARQSNSTNSTTSPIDKYGVTAATLTRWREAFLKGGEAGLKIRATDAVDEERKTLLPKLVSESWEQRRRSNS